MPGSMVVVHSRSGEGKCSQFSATLAQDELAECDQHCENRLEYSSMAGNGTRATVRTDSEIHSFSHRAIMTAAI